MSSGALSAAKVSRNRSCAELREKSVIAGRSMADGDLRALGGIGVARGGTGGIHGFDEATYRAGRFSQAPTAGGVLLDGEISAAVVKEYLLALAGHLNLRTYGEPIGFSPASGMGRADNAGFDGFVPLIDSGISVYVWSAARFFSAVVYTCKDFDGAAAIAFTKTFMDCRGDFDAQEF